ncbi:MAG: nucleoside triphosphate pyrophosphohydrolase [Candidatus Aminicenantes bacterium]|nr:nucleoside triphosphate pyrophosphohydrolase [Candidatus Aminicenantes bacterium]
MPDKNDIAGKRFAELARIIDVLRSPDGCPWDRARTKEDIINYFLEEVFEAVEALTDSSPEAAKEELGDVLMEVVFLTQFYEEAGDFHLAEVVEGINRKMKERHPHVFRKNKLAGLTAETVRENWLEKKLKEKKRTSVLEGLPKRAPALLYAFFLGQRAAGCGFDWPGPEEALSKVKEEITELEKSIKKGKKDEVAEELGDVFFSLANVSRLLGLNPEIILKKASRKFESRFKKVEQKLFRAGKKVQDCSLEELDRLWEEVKKEDGQNGRKRKKSRPEKK